MTKGRVKVVNCEVHNCPCKACWAKCKSVCGRKTCDCYSKGPCKVMTEEEWQREELKARINRSKASNQDDGLSSERR